MQFQQSDKHFYISVKGKKRKIFYLQKKDKISALKNLPSFSHLSFRPRPPSTTNFRPTEKSIAKCFLLRYCNLSPAGSILPTNILCKDMSPVSESIQIDCHRGVYLLQVNTILASQKWKNKFTKTAFFSGNGCHCILCRRIYFNLIWKKTIYC